MKDFVDWILAIVTLLFMFYLLASPVLAALYLFEVIA